MSKRLWIPFMINTYLLVLFWLLALTSRAALVVAVCLMLWFLHNCNLWRRERSQQQQLHGTQHNI